jgi:D-lactate dehydrogenase
MHERPIRGRIKGDTRQTAQIEDDRDAINGVRSYRCHSRVGERHSRLPCSRLWLSHDPERAFGLLLAVARNIIKGANRYAQEKLFSDKGLVGVELSGRTLGILGTGRIGTHAARIGHGFGMKTVAYDIVKSPRLEEMYSTRYLPLEKVLEAADFVAIHLPLNDATRGLICERTLQLMKEGSILVNTARGPIVVTQDLTKALRQGRLAGAGLDVLEDEREKYHDFTGLNVIVTPHIGWYTKESISRILDITLDNIKAFIEGTPKNRVD